LPAFVAYFLSFFVAYFLEDSHSNWGDMEYKCTFDLHFPGRKIYESMRKISLEIKKNQTLLAL
jgi:hypothetical protein